MHRFSGSMKFYADLVRLYAPQTNMVMVSDYADYNRGDKIIEVQEAVAQMLGIPFINISKLLPYRDNINTVQGYWDGNSLQNGVWHDKRFFFTYDSLNSKSWRTNQGLFLYHRAIHEKEDSMTARQMIDSFNIRKVNGTLAYDLPQRNIFFKDGLHPHSDGSGRALQQYADVLANQIKKLGRY